MNLNRSNDLLERAKLVEALVRARPNIFYGNGNRIGGYPLFVDRADGAYIWDVDGNRYIDLLLGYGSVVLGHREPRVVAAVKQQGEKTGPNPTLLSESQLDLAETVVQICPNVELVTFMKSGSDATGAAVRLMRAVTGRPYIARWGLTGWHDWSTTERSGVPNALSRFTLELDYNNIQQANELFEHLGDQIAGILMMPYEVEEPRPGYLQGLRDLCIKHNAIFALDEVRSGFRVAVGGAQQYFDVGADLVMYSKAMANGYAISALGGRAEIMENILDVGMTLTFFRNPEAMAAAKTTIEIIASESVPKRLAGSGQLLIQGIDAAAAKIGVPARAAGFPATPLLHFGYSHSSQSDRALQYFTNSMLSKGVILPSRHHWFVSAALADADIEYVLKAAETALEETAWAFN